MSELRGELASGYLEFLSYYEKATTVFKKMFKQDKKWFFLFIFLKMLSVMSQFFTIYFISQTQRDLIIHGFLLVVSGLSMLTLSFISIIFINKVVVKIEEEKEIDFFKLIFRSFILFGIKFLQELYFIYALKNGILLLILMPFIIFNLLYFNYVYVSRDIDFLKAINKNLFLSKENRMRMFFTSFPLLLLNYGLIQMEKVASGYVKNLPGILILGVAIATLMFYIIILNTIVFLNVEYVKEEKVF